jgi:hypothetical protein
VAGRCNRNFAVDFWGRRYFPKPQLRFPGTAQFENFVPWVVLAREGLDVLIHPLTGNSYDDHFRKAVWLGCAGPAEARWDAPDLPHRAVSDAVLNGLYPI